MAHERIQKALARAGVASRRKIEELVHRGRVTINGDVAQVGDKVDLEVDHVKVDGKRVQPLRRPQLYLILNKPPGYVSTVNDPENRPTVLDLLPDRMHKALFPVGRLDYDSEGLLLMTTDGEFAQKVAHPSAGCTKLYEVKVKGQPDGPALGKLSRGIMLDGRHAAPAWVESFSGPPGRRTGRDNSWFRVALKEGRTRQIREMFFRIGHPVMRLKRTQIGGFTDPFLRSGAWRELEPAEIEKLLTGEPAQRVERPSRARTKVKLEGLEGPSVKAKVKPARPMRRRITEPVAEGAPPPTRKKPLPTVGDRRRRERPEPEEWSSSKPRPEDAERSAPPRQPARGLFEEPEFEQRAPSFLYGDDDESWDQPLDGPPASRPAGGRGARPSGGEREGRTSRPPRAGGLAGWNAGEGSRPRRPAGARPSGGGGGRSAGSFGEGGSARPPRGPRGPGARPSGGFGEGRPARRQSGGFEEGSGRPPRPSRGPGGRPSAGFGEDRPARGRSRSAEDGGSRPARPAARPAARPSRPRNGAGRNTPPARPAGRGEGFPEDRPAARGPRSGAGGRGGAAGRPGAGRFGDEGAGGPSRPARPRGAFRPGGERPAGDRPSGGRPSGGARPSGGRPSGGRPSGGGRPGGDRPSGGRPSGGRPRGGGR